MNKIIIYLLLVSISTVSLAKTLATVNGRKIDSSLIDKQVSILQAQSKAENKPQLIQDNEETRNILLQTAVIQTVVSQEAKKLKLEDSKEYKNIIKETLAKAKDSGDDKKKEFKQEFELFKEQILNQAYSLYVIKNNPVTEANTKKAYDDLKKLYTGTKEVKLGNIFTKSKDDANKAFAELKKGIKFSDVAKKYSIEENAKTTGGLDTGYINLKDIQTTAPELYNIINKLKKNQHSEIIFKNNIYDIVYLADIRTAQIPNYDAVKDKILSRLQSIKVQEKISDLVKKSKIDIAK